MNLEQRYLDRFILLPTPSKPTATSKDSNCQNPSERFKLSETQKMRVNTEYQKAKRSTDNARHILKLAEQLSNTDNLQKIE